MNIIDQRDTGLITDINIVDVRKYAFFIGTYGDYKDCLFYKGYDTLNCLSKPGDWNDPVGSIKNYTPVEVDLIIKSNTIDAYHKG